MAGDVHASQQVSSNVHTNFADSEDVRENTTTPNSTPNSTSASPAINDVGDGNSSVFIWTSNYILLLLSLYEENQNNFQSGKRHKQIWQEISEKMKALNTDFTANGVQCQSKLNSLKKTYKKILDHNNTTGNDRMSWPYFDRMNEIFGLTAWAHPRVTASEAGPSSDPSENEQGPERPRKRKADTIYDKLLNHMKENHEAKMKRINEKDKAKEDRLNKLLLIKEKQHNEKISVLKEFCNILRDKN